MNQPAPGQPPPPQPQSPPPSLSSTLSSLTQLLHLTNQSLSSSPNSNLTASTQSLVTCPYNPSHVMPPEYLFTHTLHCPPPPQTLTSLLPTLNYQNTLQSSRQTQTEFVQKIDDPNVELCFDLDEFITLGSNFFYKDCPGVVRVSDLDVVKKTFTLPGFLLIECENFVAASGEIKGFGQMGFRFLTSDLWGVMREIELWGDFPIEYSFDACSVILGLDLSKGGEFKRWVIENSPRYGVVIDVYVRDHVFVLLSLCLKAIMTEARRLVSSVSSSMSFRCPVLVRVLTWLASQLSLLYGEVNGKYFALGMLKYCMLESAKGLLLFWSEENDNGCLISREGDESLDTKDVKIEESRDRGTESQKDGSVEEIVDSSAVYLSQIAAAVAALHERSMLEGKIKALWSSQQLHAYQRMAEHDYLTKRAYEERRNRSNYKPIIEHDGLPRKHSGNQESNKSKTREEMLAEERDYKRRRMSYRGKKVKRTTLTVMRDIIEEYMEEIKLAGGIGCFVKGPELEEEGKITSESHSSDVVTPDFERRNSYHRAESMDTDNFKRRNSYHHAKSMDSDRFKRRDSYHRA